MSPTQNSTLTLRRSTRTIAFSLLCATTACSTQHLPASPSETPAANSGKPLSVATLNPQRAPDVLPLPATPEPLTATSINRSSDLTPFQQWSEVNQFLDGLVIRHGFTRTELDAIFSKVTLNKTTLQLIKPAPPGKPKNWEVYRARFVDPLRIKAGAKFWDKYADALNLAQQRFGIPPEIIIGILGVETIYGKNVGNFNTLDAITSLAFAYPDTPNRDARMAYFRGELEQTLLFAREEGIDPFSLQGSYAGAIGLPQFMPSSIRKYAIDFDGDGKIDLRNSPIDAIGSIANFLVNHGWQTGLPLVFPTTITGNPDSMIAKKLEASYSLQELQAVVAPVVGLSQSQPPVELQYGLIDLQNGTNSTEYWLATSNFFVITKYNQSYFYAMSVIDLGIAICNFRKNVRSQ